MDPELQQLLAHITYDVLRGYTRDQIVDAVTERVRGVSRTRVRELIPAARQAVRRTAAFNDADASQTIEDIVCPVSPCPPEVVVRLLAQFTDQFGQIIYQSFDVPASPTDTKQDVLDALRAMAEVRAIDYNWQYMEDLTQAEGPLV